MIFKDVPKYISKIHFDKYLQVDLFNWLRDLSTGLTRLKFQDNFESFTVANLFIKAGTEVSIPNGLSRTSSGGIPSGYVVVRALGGNSIIDGDTPWTNSAVSLKNVGASDSTITVIFFK